MLSLKIRSNSTLHYLPLQPCVSALLKSYQNSFLFLIINKKGYFLRQPILYSYYNFVHVWVLPIREIPMYPLTSNLVLPFGLILHLYSFPD